MSTSTDVRERPNDQERPTVKQFTATGLTLVSGGFMLYPTRRDTRGLVALGVAALKADGYRHKTRLVVHKNTLQGKIPDELLPKRSDEIRDDEQDLDVHFLKVDEFDLSLTDGQSSLGATAINFGMVPDFESLSGGLRLKNDWRQRVGPVTWFNGGEVVAVPDRNSVEQWWQWTDFEPEQKLHRPQPLTSATVYAPSHQPSQSLVLTSKNNVSKSVSLEFKAGPVFAAFVNFAEDPDPNSYLIDFEHINEMFQLCDKHGEVRFTLGERIALNEKVTPPDLGWPEWLTKLFDKNRTFAGRPHCGARQMSAPAE